MCLYYNQSKLHRPGCYAFTVKIITIESRCNVIQGTVVKLRCFENHYKSSMSNLSHHPTLLVVFLHIHTFLTFPDSTEGIIILRFLLNIPYIKKTLRSRCEIKQVASFFYSNQSSFPCFFAIIILQLKQYQITEHHRQRYEIKTNKTEMRPVVTF